MENTPCCSEECGTPAPLPSLDPSFPRAGAGHAEPHGGVRGFLSLQMWRYVTKFTPPEAFKLIACGKLTFDERVVLHHVESDLFPRGRIS